MISKELLSEVIGVDVRYMSDEYDGNLVPYETREGWKTINIYELAHKCKEWALGYELGYEIETKLYSIDGDIFPFANIYYRNNKSKSVDTITTTEPEAIFKACQWILEQKENNG